MRYAARWTSAKILHRCQCLVERRRHLYTVLVAETKRAFYSDRRMNCLRKKKIKWENDLSSTGEIRSGFTAGIHWQFNIMRKESSAKMFCGIFEFSSRPTRYTEFFQLDYSRMRKIRNTYGVDRYLRRYRTLHVPIQSLRTLLHTLQAYRQYYGLVCDRATATAIISTEITCSRNASISCISQTG